MKQSIFSFEIIIILTSLFISNTLLSQDITPIPQGSKGDFYVYYGWNSSWYTDSDISFHGEGYDFTLQDVVALDRQSKFRFNLYFSPTKFTIPQYNFRVGYFVTDRVSVSLGVDHMKYVVTNGQTVNINGTTQYLNVPIVNTYTNEPIVITEDFLQFEHTDGLNYINIDVRLSEHIYTYKHFSIQGDIGAGIGALLPKTNTAILGRERHDDFHLSGFGLNGLAAMDFRFYENYFIKTELKGGYINMPDIRTTADTVDGASQSFMFSELTLVFGVQF